MTKDDYIGVDQAVFGYSNGHRQLASSAILSSIDMYELAAASDLAPGVDLSLDNSYLTGMVLPESKRYALIRTWLAPEMPRPGCVWSHVLLVGREVLASLVDLTILNECFRRPSQYESDESLSMLLAVNRLRKGRRAKVDVVEKVIEACYGDIPLKAKAFDDRERELAILAVWSQQWPRMRTRFVFRSVPSTTDLKDQSLRFQRGVSLRKTSPPAPWVVAATEDAISGQITPLRRFLWRYGKDIRTRKDTFRDLVQIFLETRDHIDVAKADHVFSVYRDGDAETLKRDMLGLTPGKLSLVPSISVSSFLDLLGRHYPDNLSISDQELLNLFSRLAPEHLPDAVGGLYQSQERLGSAFELLKGAMLGIATSDNLLDHEVPGSFVLDVLKVRPGLISERVLSRLSTDELYYLIGEVPEGKLEPVMATLLSREFDGRGNDIIVEQAERMLLVSASMYQRSMLDDSWRGPLRHWFDLLAGGLSQMTEGRDLIAAASLLKFKLGPPDVLDRWYEAFGRLRSDLSHDDETRMMVYLFTWCIDNGVEQSRRVVIGILPELRSRVLAGQLPNETQEMLSHFLPWDEHTWDLNKRVLKLFRNLYKRGRSMGDILEALHLTDEEYAYASDQDPKSLVRGVFNAMMGPWGVRWD